MDQADLRNIPARAAREDYLAITQDQQFRCHLITRALAGLANLAAPDDINLSQEEANVIREDLGAIFELLAANLEEVTGKLPLVSNVMIEPELFATEKRRRR